MLLLLSLAIAAEDGAPSDPPPAKEEGMRIFLGGGNAQSSGGAAGAAELGFHLTRWGRRVGGEFGGSLSAYAVNNVTVPVLNGDAMVTWRPSPDWKVQPVLGAGAGLSFLLILPFPSFQLSLGAAVDLGELRLDATLRARQLVDIYSQGSGATVSTLELGLGF